MLFFALFSYGFQPFLVILHPVFEKHLILQVLDLEIFGFNDLILHLDDFVQVVNPAV